MNRRLALCGLLVFSVSAPLFGAPSPDRPNILFFYVDDMGWGSIGPNGQADRKSRGLPYVRTPNIDRLAAEGVNFTRGYGCHVCSPARSSLQTGFHQGHTFADRNDPNNAKKAIRAEDVSIGTALSSAGYVTGYWGKWGYGGSKDQAHPVIENVQTLPTSHGFKHVLAELHHVRAHTFFQPTLWHAPASADAAGGLELTPNTMAAYQGDGRWPASPALQNHPRYPKTAYCDDSYAFAALDFVRTQGVNFNKTGQPFFGLLAVQIPHAPFGEIVTLPEWDRTYRDDAKFASLSAQTKQWAAMVTRIDAHFGNILAALEDPNNDGDASDSIADNTLIVFQSDNGGPAGKNNLELDANGGLSGNKGKIQEGGIRVPLVMRWPSKITAGSKLRAGSNCDRVVDVTDLLPTFCDLAGARTPVGIDGVSIAPMLSGSGHQRRRDFIIHEAGNGQSIIHGRYKLVRSRKSPLKLHDLEADPAEAKNTAKAHPKLVSDLKSLLLGERVDEPKGFANTYHHWIGQDGGKTSAASNWSDYRYSNAGITYMEDAGSPRPSWVARIANTTDSPQLAVADVDLSVLGLEVVGGDEHKALQSLVVSQNATVTGRNEIRVGSHGAIRLEGGSAASLRWVDVQQGGMIEGHGSIQGNVINSGSVSVGGEDDAVLSVSGDYRQSSNATLGLTLGRNRKASLRVSGNAQLAGTLAVGLTGGKMTSGESITVLDANRVAGRFSNSEVVADDGTRLSISYSKTKVSLTVK